MDFLVFLMALMLCYSAFMLFAYILSHLIFTRMEKAEERQQQEKLVQIVKSRRIRKAGRITVTRSKSSGSVHVPEFRVQKNIGLLEQGSPLL